MPGKNDITGGPTGRRVSTEIDGRAAAFAVVEPADDSGTVHAVLYGEMTPIPGDADSRLVDAVLELPEVATAHRIAAAVSTADAGILQRLQESADEVQTRRAGGTVLVDAQIRHPEEAQDIAPAAGAAGSDGETG